MLNTVQHRGTPSLGRVGHRRVLLPFVLTLGACGDDPDASPPVDDEPTMNGQNPQGAPTVVFVHGAWHTPDQWDSVGGFLDERNIRWAAVDLPSAGPNTRERPNGDGSVATVFSSLPGDVSEATEVIEQQPGPVVLVGHSYGGFVLNQAGLHPQVAHLTYLCAFAPDRGETLVDLAVAEPPPLIIQALRISENGLLLTIDRDLAPQVFYGDLSPEEQRAAVDKLVPSVSFIFDEPSGYPAWRERPATYVVCSDDQAISPVREREMGARIGGEVIELQSSHSPFLSQPEVVADIISTIISSL